MTTPNHQTDPASAPTPSPESLPTDLPPLTTYLTSAPSDKIAALRLIADSIAQQRQQASRALILHPLTLGAYVLLLAIAARVFLTWRGNDLPLFLTFAAGATLAALAGVRVAVQGYLAAAERIGYPWLRSGDGDRGGGAEDEVLVTKFGEQVVGVVVVRLIAGDDGVGRGGEEWGGRGGGKRGIFRAWTVKMRYRGHGLGGNLLVEGVQLVRRKLGEDAEVEWAADHANAVRILPAIFNTSFGEKETLARKLLEDIARGRHPSVGEWDKGG